MVNTLNTRIAGRMSGLMIAAVALGLMGLAACGKDDDKKIEAPAAPTFASVSSIFTADCNSAGCHDGASQAKFEEATLSKAVATSALSRIALAPSNGLAMPQAFKRAGATNAYELTENGAKIKAYLQTIK